MIHLNPNLTQEQARYVMEEVIPKSGWRIDRTTLGYWEKAHNYVFMEQVGQPSCSCEMVATMKIWQSRINQYEQHIKDIAYPITTTSTGQTGYTANQPEVKARAGRKPKAASGLTE